MMTGQQLSAIASRATAATAEEWAPSADSDVLCGAYLHVPEAGALAGPRAIFTEGTDECLFSHARADILALVAEVRRVWGAQA
jgi:hypothetical protein